jgi:hypothetical protein
MRFVLFDYWLLRTVGVDSTIETPIYVSSDKRIFLAWLNNHKKKARIITTLSFFLSI